MSALHRGALLSVAICAVALAGAAPASAQGVDGNGTDLLITVAARSCPSYEAITANLARNDIQESLRDLGPDTLYTSGEPINPTKEAEGQPQCSPLPNWRFTQGTGIAGSPVVGSWGSLSVVSDPFSTDVVTQATTPTLDDQGRRVPGQSIQGATTIELTQEQADDAASNNLWIQGGAVDDPVLDKVYPGTYGFGALRCAIDNLNGDNVEYTQFPSGTRHVFCYAYYVVPPPSSGTIVVRKAVRSAPDVTESFVMGGNLSYDPSGTFTLTARKGQTDEQTFFRAAGDTPWTISEQVPDGWALADLSCTKTGASVVTTDRATTRTSIRLAAGDTVTCTYTNVLRPTSGALLLRKITLGDLGTFPLSVLSGGDEVAERSVTTRREGVAASAKPIKLKSGRYRVSEKTGARFKREGLTCNGRRSAGLVSITAGRGAVCTFTNRRRRLTAIGVREITEGGLGTAPYTITALNGDRSYQKSATTRREGVARTATGDRTIGVPFGTYVINQGQVSSSSPGTWTLVKVTCDGRLVPFAGGRAVIRVTNRNPRIACTFTNRLTSPSPVPPPLPPDVPPVVPGSGEPNLVVTKTPQRRRVAFGGVVGYTLRVRNTGTATAENAVVADRPGRGAQLMSATPSQGSCRQSLPLVCRLGRIDPGESATVGVRLRMTRPGVVPNLAVVGSASSELRLRDNLAVAAARVLRRPRPGACPSSPRARASC